MVTVSWDVDFPFISPQMTAQETEPKRTKPNFAGITISVSKKLLSMATESNMFRQYLVYQEITLESTNVNIGEYVLHSPLLFKSILSSLPLIHCIVKELIESLNNHYAN